MYSNCKPTFAHSCIYMCIYTHMSFCICVHMSINNGYLWEVGWWLIPKERQCVPYPCWNIRRPLGFSPFRFPNFAHYPCVSGPLVLSFNLASLASGCWSSLLPALCSGLFHFYPISLPHQFQGPHVTEVLFFTSPWTSFISWLWLFFAKLVPLGLHFSVPLLVLSAIHMPTWPACFCGLLATRSEGLAICLAFAHPQCFFHFPYNL